MKSETFAICYGNRCFDVVCWYSDPIEEVLHLEPEKCNPHTAGDFEISSITDIETEEPYTVPEQGEPLYEIIEEHFWKEIYNRFL